MTPRAQLAIFVGGKSHRMGQAKGGLLVPGGTVTILERLSARARDADLSPFLVGEAGPYEGLVADLVRVSDDPPGAGPLAGLRAALVHVGDDRQMVAVACDMPNVAVDALVALRDHPSNAPIVAPRRSRESPWEPMLARYRPDEVLPVLDHAMAEGCRSFQKLFARIEVCPIDLSPAIEKSLEDWDTPADVVT